MKIMICILAEVINLICPLIVMQVTSYIINTSIFDFLQNEGSIFAAGAIVSKILLWLVYKGLYSSFQYLVLYFPKEQIILTIVLVGFAVISENCIFLAVSQKGVSHYTVILLLIVSFGIIALCGYVIYMMITISKKSEKNQKEKRIICRIAREADEVNIFVENSIEQSVLAENQLLETTKDKKDQHGMGHLIVEEQVKRLGGMVEYYEDEMFCAHVYLSV